MLLDHHVELRITGTPASCDQLLATLKPVTSMRVATLRGPYPRRPAPHECWYAVVDLDQPIAPAAAAEIAKHAHDLDAELSILTGAQHALERQPWYPIQPGDVVGCLTDAGGATFLAVDSEYGTVLEPVATADATIVDGESVDFIELWYEIGAARLTILRAGQIVHHQTVAAQ